MRREWRDIVLPLGLLIVIAAQIFRSPTEISFDTSVNLDYGARILDGQKPYLDFYDTNPPLILHLSALPVLVARLLHREPAPVYSVMVTALCVAAGLVIRSRLRAFGWEGRALVLTVWMAFSWYLLFARDYGQREHLFLIGYLPFFFLRHARWSGERSDGPIDLLVAAAAGLFACLKPAFLGVMLVPELYWLVSARSFRPFLARHLLAFLAPGVAYALLLALRWDSTHAYLTRWAPLLVKGYSRYDSPLAWLLVPSLVLVPLAALLVATTAGAAPRATRSIVVPLALFGVTAAGVLYLLPLKAWFYHLIPGIGASALACACAFLVPVTEEVPGFWKSLRSSVGLQLLPLAAFAYLAVTNPFDLIDYGYRRNLINILERYSHEGDPVMVISTYIFPQYPVVPQLHRQQASHYTFFWSVPMFYAGASAAPGKAFAYHDEPQQPREERLFVQELDHDVATKRPRVVVVATHACQGCPPGFNLPAYLRHIGFMDRTLAPYQEVPDPDGRDSFTTWVRRER